MTEVGLQGIVYQVPTVEGVLWLVRGTRPAGMLLQYILMGNMPTDDPGLDAVETAPNSHRVLYEDDTVRILRVTVKPGEFEPMHVHSHPSAMIVHQSAPLVYHTADGESFEIPEHVSETPKMEWMKPEGLHAVENAGDTTYEAVRVEYKQG